MFDIKKVLFGDLLLAYSMSSRIPVILSVDKNKSQGKKYTLLTIHWFREDKWGDKVNSENGELLKIEKSSRPLDETNSQDRALLQLLLNKSVNIDDNYFYYFNGQNTISSICASVYDIMHKLIHNTRKIYYRIMYNGTLCCLFNGNGKLIGDVVTFSTSRRTGRYTKHIFLGFEANLSFEDIVKEIETQLRCYPEVIWHIGKDDPMAHDFDMYLKQKKDVDKYTVSRKKRMRFISYSVYVRRHTKIQKKIRADKRLLWKIFN